MKITYDRRADALYLYLQEGVRVETTREAEEGVIIDYDAKGAIIGIEVLGASHCVAELVPAGGTLEVSQAV